MTIPTTLELSLDGIAQGGAGVGRWGDQVVFVDGGLPGERVRVQIDERRSNYARGHVAEVIERSPDRVEPRLPEASHMPWQHIDYPAQLRFKRQIIIDQLAKIGGLPEAPVAAMIPSARIWGYRNSAHVHGVGAQIGYFAAESHDLAPIASDPLLLPVLNEALDALRSVLAGSPAPGELMVRTSEAYGYALAALRRPAGAQAEQLALAARWRAACPALAGVALPGGAALGADHLIEELGGVAFRLRPATFFQVNCAAAAALLELVRAGLALTGSERVLDLYCGAGAFTLPLAGQARELVGIEEYAEAVADGQASAELNQIENVRFVAGRAERALAEVGGDIDAVVLDPPRRGCHPQAISQIIALAPARVVYVACQPATLARDLKLLVAGGYQVAQVQPVDLFPQTAHIECVVVLVRSA